MCARRFLFVVLILTLLVVAGAFAIFQFGQSVLLSQATPQGQFKAPPAASGPDYSQIDNWIARPTANPSTNPSQWLPDGFPPPTLEPRQVSVFYVHPTTYLKRDRWNAPISGNGDSDDRAALFVRSQSSAFNGIGEIWAPRYRQAAYGAFLLDTKDSRKSLDLAYGDVRAAFAQFLKEIPKGQPIILAGHSQGSLHLTRLLEDYGPRIRDRLVAAYVGGWPVSIRADLPTMGLPACTKAEEAGCVLSWQSFAEPANPNLILDSWVGTKGPTGIKRERSDMLCVDPVNGIAGGSSPPSANAGTLVPNGDLSTAKIERGQIGARCEKGFLIISGDIPPMGPFVLPGNNYHVYDYALFWGAIRDDAARRLKAWHR